MGVPNPKAYPIRVPSKEGPGSRDGRLRLPNRSNSRRYTGDPPKVAGCDVPRAAERLVHGVVGVNAVSLGIF